MPKLKVLSAKEVVEIFCNLGFEVISQKGSYVKLVRQTNFQKQILVVPNHKTIRKGTLRAIFTQSSKFVSQEKLLPYFYTEA